MSTHQIQPQQYQELLSAKQTAITEQFARFSPPALETYPSPPSHYRMRAEFKLWHQGDACFYAMQPPGDKSAAPILMRDFPVASKTINAAMPKLLDLLAAQPDFKRRLFQVEFLSTTSAELLITLIYHRPLDEPWQQQAIEFLAELKQSLATEVSLLELIGRSRKKRIVLGNDFVTESLDVNGTEFRYQQVENSFTQPNATICRKMLEWACQCSQALGGDLLELYCGNGNFTLPLAQNFDQVFATEISKTSVNSANYNIKANAVENVTVARLSAEEFTQAFAGVRPFRRLQGINLTDYRFSTVFVDPPRAGLDADTCKLVSDFDNILYVSCNPNSLAENLDVLTQTHSITRLALFDQFPYTHHAECGAFLQRKR
ncbi:tRNA (uridine(54)-C5)-methyltransferase TrmA [Halioxenophilus aromaticivorans]|uniref:tRNA/tmRNA (uracil-C(5))-methyltransferase n=1 Tax=Halioxenophilus aromaticivorans TaxID=1306992 RepID=A0AAV3UAA1_9ALTE